jgi:Uma2 family endonuclease
MTVILASVPPDPDEYPERDGSLLADDTQQARWIVILFDNLLALFAEAADVFIAADILWYPVEGEPDTRIAPDVLVAFGRPKGDRGSYKQWEEGAIAPQVVFEILSPGNDPIEMADKLDFYDRYGVEEYYIYDPDRNRLAVYVRQGAVLRRVRSVDNFTSPRLKIRFQLTAPEMTVYRPDGRPFLMFDQLRAVRVRAEEACRQAAQRVEQAHQWAAQAKQRWRQADEARRRAEQSATQSAAEVERLRRLLDATGKTGDQA